MSGGIAAVVLYKQLHDESLLVVVAFVGTLGLGHTSWRLWRQRHPIIEPKWSFAGLFSPTERSGLLSGASAQNFQSFAIDIDSDGDSD